MTDHSSESEDASTAPTVDQPDEIYRQTEDGGVQLASNADRWHLYEEYVHLDPGHPHEDVRWSAEKKDVVDSPDRAALAIIDMQNDFCEPGGWVDSMGLEPEDCRDAIPEIQRAIEAARELGMWIIWINWQNRRDLRNLGAPTLYSFKKDPDQAGIGEELENGEVLTEDSWGGEIVEDLQPYMDEDDIHVEKVRMSGFYGTHLEQVLRTQGIQTLFLAGVNIDQCVATTMEDAYFRDYNPILLRDAAATSSPDFCKKATVFNAELCWGFSMSVDSFEDPEPFDSPQ